MKYWDASALLPLLTQEAATARRAHQLGQDSEILTWWATHVECASALARLAREGRLSVKALEAALDDLAMLADGWTEVQPTPAIQNRALRLLRVHPLRAGDALQLAASLNAVGDAPRDFPFVCADTRLADAARKEGFRVLD